MNSLSAHLTAGPDHGRLRFHPDCPVCCSQRLFGALHDPVLPARTQAGLLVAALGAGSLLPAAGAAASPDADRPSAAQVSDTSTPVPAPVPDGMQPEADETQEAPIDEAPEVRELVTNPDLGTDSGGEDVTGDDAVSTPPLAPTPVEPPPAEQPLPTEPAPVPPSVPPEPAPAAPIEPPAAPPAQLDQPPTGHAPGKVTERQAQKRAAELRDRAPGPVAESPATAPPISPPPVTEAAPSAPAETVAVSQPANGSVSGPSYTVRTGDSLWSIARRVLGPQASAGRIAREVNRLWGLNQERIATGDPSLVHAWPCSNCYAPASSSPMGRPWRSSRGSHSPGRLRTVALRPAAARKRSVPLRPPTGDM